MVYEDKKSTFFSLGTLCALIYNAGYIKFFILRRINLAQRDDHWLVAADDHDVAFIWGQLFLKMITTYL